MASEHPSTPRPHPTAALRNKVVVLSGATGTLGTRVLDALAEVGAKIAVPVRRSSAVARIGERIGADRHLVALVGSADGEAAAGFAKGVVDSLGAIDAVISTTGSYGESLLGDDRAGMAEQLLEANFLAVHNLVRATLPAMVRRRAGRLVLTGTAAPAPPRPGLSLFLAAQAALHTYAECLACELRDTGVGIHVIRRQIDGPGGDGRIVTALLDAAAGSIEDPWIDVR